jgi:hypothetical protein
MRKGLIVWGEDLDCNTTDEAAVSSRALWDSHPQSSSFDGIEIWHSQFLVYSDGETTRSTAYTFSPFQTAESTIYPNWRPTKARPIGMPML